MIIMGRSDSDWFDPRPWALQPQLLSSEEHPMDQPWVQQEEETQVLAELPPKSPQPEQSEAGSLTPAHQHVGEGWE